MSIVIWNSATFKIILYEIEISLVDRLNTAKKLE